MHSESSDQGNRGAGTPTAEGVVLLSPKRHIEWWVWVAGGLIAVRAAFLAIPYATHGGEAGMFFWSFGIESVFWNWPTLFVTLVALVIAVRRRPFWTRPRVVGAILLAIGAVAGRFAPLCVYPSSHDDSPSQVRFRLPLDGPVTVAHGGPNTLVNYHAAYPDQRWAYDLEVTREGKSHRGDGKKLDDYYCYGLSVLAPADGTVRSVMNDDEDLPIGQDTGFINAGGNQVTIEVASKEFLFICHMQPDSITVKPGDLVTTGQVLGRVGNSGHTSEPHVHIHLQDTPEDGWGEGIPLYFHNYLRDGKLIDRGIPTGGDLLGSDPIGQIVEQGP